ncbi:MAG: CvpA family protein [Bauldia sp.]|nr:CvpA family protein [Bauldia sp.]
MPVTVLDVIVLVVVLISAVLAMVRGFVREVLSVASWVAAAAAAYYFYKSLLPLVAPYFDNKTLATIVSAAIIFFVALIVASYITMKISDFVIDSRVGAVDRAFGFIFGAVRGVLLLVIALLFFNWLVPAPPAWVADARTKPFLDNLGEQLMAALPEDAEATLLNRIKGAAGGGGASDDAADTGAPDAAPGDAAEPAYDDDQRGAIDQLIENTDPGAAD